MNFAAQTQAALAQGNTGLAIGLAAVGGFLTALSPCVYPLIPITISVFGGNTEGARGKNFSLALSYTLGMVLLYAVLGTTFASAGKVFGTLLANHWVVLAFALFCAAMAASMLGAFEISLPSGLQTKLSLLGGRGYKGAFLMGLASGLVAAPCTGPVLSVLLTFIAQSGSRSFGFVLMLGFSLGLGVPFLVLATFSGLLRSIPRSGGWMDVVKGVLAAAMIGLTLYYLQFIAKLPALPLMLGAALAVVGFFLVLASTRAGVAVRAVGALAAGFGLFLVLGVRTVEATPLRWETDVAAAMSRAKSEHKPVIIDFFATWCAACVELDKETYSQAEVQRALADTVTIKVDGTDETDAVTALYKQYDVKGLPTVVFITADGRVLSTPRITGFTPPAEFLTLLSQAK